MAWDTTKVDGVDGLTAAEWNTHVTDQKTRGQKKIGNFTRDISLASGTQTITGIGFQPSVLILLTNVNASVMSSWGFDDAITHNCVTQNSGGGTDFMNNAGSLSAYIISGANSYNGYVQSMDADGFTMNWTKIGTPTGTATVQFIAFR